MSFTPDIQIISNSFGYHIHNISRILSLFIASKTINVVQAITGFCLGYYNILYSYVPKPQHACFCHRAFTLASCFSRTLCPQSSLLPSSGLIPLLPFRLCSNIPLWDLITVYNLIFLPYTSHPDLYLE